MTRREFGFVFAFAFAACACGSEAPDAAPKATPYVWPTDDWAVDTPEQQGMDSTRLDVARQYAMTDAKHTQGVVVIRHGVIVAEWYAPGHDATSFATSWSMGKSFASTLIGIAISEGRIAGPDVPMSDFFPEWAADTRAPITLRHVLSMTTGRKWVEEYTATSANSDVIMMGTTKDELQYARDAVADVAPGTRWLYSSGDSMLMSGVIEAVTGGSALDYAQNRLLAPLGMKQAQWWQDGVGSTLTYCCVDTSSREFAKLGFLFLHGGEWDGAQIVPKAWVAEATRPSQQVFLGYGLQWWVNVEPKLPADLFYADGFDGQFIYVVPSRDLVVVRNSTYTKPAGDPVAPYGINLKIVGGGVSGAGTIPPDEWDATRFLGPILDSITDGT